MQPLTLRISNAAFLDRTAENVTIENGLIVSVLENGTGKSAVELIDLGGLNLFPGFVDVHNHGAVGVDVNEADVDGLLKISAFLARHGVTAWLPTLVPDSDENYRLVIGEIEKVMAFQGEMPIAQIVGVHYEGVFANEQMCGALRPEFFKRFTGGELSELPRLKHGVHMTTFAPEIEGGAELAAELAAKGWIASIGHTRADVAMLDRAFAAGAKHVTHFFNAMTGIHHRDVGVAGWALATDGVTFDIIADGIHVDCKMFTLAARAKGVENVSLISDSIGPTGLGDGEFQVWGETISVTNGQTRNQRGSIAGSVITMADAVRMALENGFLPEEVSKMASANPARLLGMSDERGSIVIGKRADLVAFDANGRIEFVMIGGKTVPLDAVD
ncbi:MAG: N-acetylglucosamine-6-phosphate deacetylase [Pyrinomonadaceae bacterium]